MYGKEIVNKLSLYFYSKILLVYLCIIFEGSSKDGIYI